MNWESTGLLRGLKNEEVVLLTEILEKIEPKASEAYARVCSEHACSIKDELLSNLLPTVRLCWERSGIQDSEWIASDFEKWIDEENEAIEYRFKNAYMRMDVVVEIQIWYADIHGNRYLKQHGHELWNESK